MRRRDLISGPIAVIAIQVGMCVTSQQHVSMQDCWQWIYHIIYTLIQACIDVFALWRSMRITLRQNQPVRS